MMLGELDDVVSNKASEQWHSTTPELEDKQRIVFPKMCHQLHKDPMKNVTFTAVLNFIEKRLSGKGPVIYQYNPMKQGYLGEVAISKSAKLLRFLIYVYIIVCVVRVGVRNN